MELEYQLEYRSVLHCQVKLQLVILGPQYRYMGTYLEMSVRTLSQRVLP